MSEPNSEPLLTTAQVAAITGKTVATINRWAANGTIPVAQRLPGRTGANLFRRADIEQREEVA